jgi:ABC-type uncharacterized transport system substrate-binding protein
MLEDTCDRRQLLAALALSSWAPVARTAATPLRVVHVMSYHAPWRWTDGQLDGFREALAGVPHAVEVFQMDTKQHSTPAAKEKMGRAARALIDRIRPDLLYTSDDDAQEYVARHYAGSTMPVVFSGVNADPAVYGFAGAPNVTGVQEHEHFAESVKLLRAIVPDARRVVVILDDAGMWASVAARMRLAAAQAGIDVVAWETIRTWAAYKARVGFWQDRADALALIGIFNFQDGANGNVPYQTVLRWTAENSRLPDLSFWLDRVKYGTLASVTVSEREQGLAAGRLARAILVEGKAPASLPMRPTTRGQPVVSLARARRLGLQVRSSVLLSSEVVNAFEWEQAAK